MSVMKNYSVICKMKSAGFERVGEFRSFEDWVTKARSKIGGTGAKCFDNKFRPCRFGKDFMRARDENAFPVSYWIKQ